MKRFFCTVCQRIKRVRKYPKNIENQYAESPANRHGVCSYHSITRRDSLRHSNEKVAR